jgi:hypothetical protein
MHRGLILNANEMIEELKRVVTDDVAGTGNAMDDEVIWTVTPRFDTLSGRLIVDVNLKSANGLPLSNFANGLIYYMNGGKGGDTFRSVRSWGVAESMEIQTGIVMAVAEKGNHLAAWTIGTFVRTADGYKLWTQSAKFEFKV